MLDNRILARKGQDLNLLNKAWSEIRKQHREPVIRALLALLGETLVEVSARPFLVAGFLFLKNASNKYD